MSIVTDIDQLVHGCIIKIQMLAKIISTRKHSRTDKYDKRKNRLILQ